jgi:hypothetical protein
MGLVDEVKGREGAIIVAIEEVIDAALYYVCRVSVGYD